MAAVDTEEMMTVKYTDRLRSELQKTANELRSRATVHVGIRDKLVEISKIGKRTLTLSTNGKNSPEDVDNTFIKRWMAAKFYVDKHVEDRQFALQSQLANQIFAETQDAQLAACQRQIDADVVAALIGNAMDGPQDNLTNVALPNSQKIAVNAVFGEAASSSNPATGLTFDKIRLTRNNLLRNYALGRHEKGIMLVTSYQLMELLNDEKATSAEFQMVKGLINGDINNYMGFDWVIIPELPYDSTNKIRTCIGYVKSAVDVGFWEDSRTVINHRPDLQNNRQIMTTIGLGAVRSEDKGVVAIACHEEPEAADTADDSTSA